MKNWRLFAGTGGGECGNEGAGLWKVKLKWTAQLVLLSSTEGLCSPHDSRSVQRPQKAPTTSAASVHSRD